MRSLLTDPSQNTRTSDNIPTFRPHHGLSPTVHLSLTPRTERTTDMLPPQSGNMTSTGTPTPELQFEGPPLIIHLPETSDDFLLPDLIITWREMPLVLDLMLQRLLFRLASVTPESTNIPDLYEALNPVQVLRHIRDGSPRMFDEETDTVEDAIARIKVISREQCGVAIPFRQNYRHHAWCLNLHPDRIIITREDGKPCPPPRDELTADTDESSTPPPAPSSPSLPEH